MNIEVEKRRTLRPVGRRYRLPVHILLSWLSVSAAVFGCPVWAEGPVENPQTEQNIHVGDTFGAGRIVLVIPYKDELLFLSQNLTGAFALLALRRGNAPEHAVILLPPAPGRAVTSVHPASDAVYVQVRDGGREELLRIPVRSVGGVEIDFSRKASTACRNCRSFPAYRRIIVQKVPLPVGGAISEFFSDPAKPGVQMAWENPGQGTTKLTYDPAGKRFVRSR